MTPLNATIGGTVEQVGVTGTIDNFRVLVLGDVVAAERDVARIARRQVEGLGRFVVAARALKLGWGDFPGGAEVIHLFDAGDGGFDDVLNLACDWCGEKRSAPFACSAPVLAAESRDRPSRP